MSGALVEYASEERLALASKYNAVCANLGAEMDILKDALSKKMGEIFSNSSQEPQVAAFCLEIAAEFDAAWQDYRARWRAIGFGDAPECADDLVAFCRELQIPLDAHDANFEGVFRAMEAKVKTEYAMAAIRAKVMGEISAQSLRVEMIGPLGAGEWGKIFGYRGPNAMGPKLAEMKLNGEAENPSPRKWYVALGKLNPSQVAEVNLRVKANRNKPSKKRKPK